MDRFVTYEIESALNEVTVPPVPTSQIQNFRKNQSEQIDQREHYEQHEQWKQREQYKECKQREQLERLGILKRAAAIQYARQLQARLIASQHQKPVNSLTITPVTPTAYKNNGRTIIPTNLMGYKSNNDNQTAKYERQFEFPECSQHGSSNIATPMKATAATNSNVAANYSKLLTLIKEIRNDIRPSCKGSRNSMERLKRNIAHARILINECRNGI
uniref:Uncharacterized protein n=1 Tax=Glossina brevipalpis TaxID=37001 RepID=A0A1A9WXR2_9MUSC